MVNVFSQERALYSLKEFSDQKSGVRRLLSLPSLQHHVLRACNDPLNSNEQIANLVKYDPTLVAKVLNLSSLTGDTQDIRERIATTPRESIKQLVLSSCAERYALYTSARPEVFDFIKQQWINSLQTAFLARSFAYQFGYTKPEQAYFAGLTHNIGKLLFQSEDIDDYFLLQQSAENETELLALEQQQYGFDHAMLGGYLANQWKTEVAVQDAIRYHHTEVDKIQDAHPLTRIVYLARCIAEFPFASFKELMLFTRRLFQVEHDELIPLVESALTQTGDVIRSLNINVPENLVAQSLVPFLPEEQSHSQLQETAKNHQLMREIHTCGVIDAADIALSGASNETELQQLVNHSTKALYGTSQCLFFRYDKKSQSLQGKNLVVPHCVSNEIEINLNNERSLLTEAYRSQLLNASFGRDFEELSVIDREIIDHTLSSGIICAPILPMSKGTENHSPWGIIVLGFDSETEYQTPTFQASIRYFSQKVARHLERIEALRSNIRQVQVTEKGLYTAILKRMVHEINNPLSIAQNNIHVLGLKNEDNPELKERLLNIQDEITRAANLLKKHLDETIQERNTQNAININELTSDLLLVFKEGFLDAKDIVCEQELDQTIPAVYIDEDAIKQIITNLVKNAAESMEEGGSLGIRTFDQFIIDDKAYIEIQIIDDGPGVPKPVLEKLFSPVDTNKGIGHAGLGLSIVKELSHAIDGFVSYRRSPEARSIFSIYLPRRTQPPEPTQ